MKKLILLMTLILMVFLASAQSTEDLIKATALDYGEGYYSGDAVRMKRALHPDLHKGIPRYLQRAGKVAITLSTYSGLIDITAAKRGPLDDTARHIKVSVLYNDTAVALVSFKSARFNDYLQMIKTDEGWKIINVLFNTPENIVWLKDRPEQDERKEIGKAIDGYLLGSQKGDAAKIERYVSKDFNRVSFIPVGPGKTAMMKTGYDGLSGNATEGYGRTEETQRDNSWEIIDIMDGLAMAKAITVTSIDYLQLYRDSDGWKVFNSLVKAKNRVLADLIPPIIGEPMPDFTLPVHGGGDFRLSAHQGKNVLLMFPRGWTGNQWCLFCPYQYLDLSQLEQKEHFMKKYNLDVVFVMPYSDERIDQWFSDFPKAVAAMDRMKGNAKTGTGMQKQFGEWVVTHFPNTFEFKDGEVEKTFPVLCDENQTLSKRLYLYTGFWDGITADQNVSAIYLIDKTGKLRWKYVSQITEDRPSTEYLMETVHNYCR